MEDDIKIKRNKKSDKKKRKFEINGKVSKKYIRISQEKKNKNSNFITK